MVIIISGATHTGKTFFAQKLLEKYNYPCLSIDHLKMGLIRSGQTTLTPYDDNELVPYLWSIVREIIKTVVENKQNLIVEGCYIPFDWRKDFTAEYLKDISCRFLIMTEKYIRNHYEDIKKYANIIEERLSDDIEMEQLIEENRINLEMCCKYDCEYILIDNDYSLDLNREKGME